MSAITQQLMSYGGTPAGAFWNASDKGANIALSNGNKTAGLSSGDSINQLVRSTIGKSSGKIYFELTAAYTTVELGRFMAVGIATAAPATSRYVGQDTTSYGWWGPGIAGSPDAVVFKNGSIVSAASGLSYTSVKVLRGAFDIPGGKLFLGVDGTWANSGDPAAGTNPVISGIAADTWYLAATPFRSASSFTLRQPSEFTFAAPAGFQAGWY